MFGNLGLPQGGVLVLLALFLFGPERLPSIAADLGRLLRQIRAWAKELEQEIKVDLGPEVGDLDLRSLNTRDFIRRHLLEDEVVNVAHQRSVFVPGGPVPGDPHTT